MKSTKILMSLIFFVSSSLSYAKQAEIVEWNNVDVKKGYILSLDIQKNECDKIWSKQIKEFKKQNKHIKNPDLIRIGKKIKVQSCIKKNQPEKQLSQNENKESSDVVKLSQYVSVFGGLSSLAEDSMSDSGKKGYLIGVKLGYEIVISGDHGIAIDLGITKHRMESDDNNNRPEYRVDNNIINLGLHYNKFISSKMRLGGIINLATGQNISFRENGNDQYLGLFGGIEALYEINKKWDFEANIQQRIDELSRQHIISNIGIKYNY